MATATVLERFTDEQVESFRRDGFLIVEEGLLSPGAIEVLRERFAALFDGDYATGIAPDEVNWKAGRDPDDVRARSATAGAPTTRSRPRCSASERVAWRRS